MKTNTTQARLKELFSYDEKTGDLTRILDIGGAKIGDIAGSMKRGYKTIRVDGSSYYAHRLVWLYVYGHFPKLMLDHINRIRSDNRLVNLREVSVSENNQNTSISKNNSTGYSGISFHKATGKYQARIGVDGKSKYLGIFISIKNAIVAQTEAKLKYHPMYTCV